MRTIVVEGKGRLLHASEASNLHLLEPRIGRSVGRGAAEEHLEIENGCSIRRVDLFWNGGSRLHVVSTRLFVRLRG